MIARKRICKGLDISVEDLFIDIDRLARAFYPAILACWNSEEGQREFAAWQAEQAHHTPQQRENRAFPTGNALLYISLLSVAFGRVRPTQGRALFFTMLHRFLRAASGIRHQHGSGSDAVHPGIVPIFCAGTPYKHAKRQCHFPAYCPIFSA